MTEILDPIERTVADALDAAGIAYETGHSNRDGLDFTLANGVQIECKAFYTERVTKQLERHRDVILIQGKGAAEAFAAMLRSTHGG